jgi:hypothetical protein
VSILAYTAIGLQDFSACGFMPGSILEIVYDEEKDDLSDSDFEDSDSVESEEDSLNELDDDKEMFDIE